MVVISTLAVIILIYQLLQMQNEEEIESFSNHLLEEQSLKTKQEDIPPPPSLLIVDLKGEIKNPGVYEIIEGSRVNDVIKKAGGFTDEADQLQVNLASIVQDTQMIYIPKEGEVIDHVQKKREGNGKILINSASLQELQELPGIGPSKASAIIKYREENGGFKNKEDLLNVTGIGVKSLEKFQELIAIH